MGRGVDAAGEPRHDRIARVAELAGDPLGELRSRPPKQLREPTTAIMFEASTSALPRTPMSGGASSIMRSRAG